ncbi:START domain-containing protein [Acinetobacter soli]|uniref:START domain-containing protein n=1 Tax=Acinetobacter soli TaxID=487316 RepID=UPI0032B55257
MKKKSWLLALLLTLTTSAQSAPANEKLSLVRNNIKVWTYRSEANPVIQYKAETTYDVPLERAVSLVLDVARAPEWVPYMGDAKILSRDDKKGEFVLYMVLDFPFPLKDRDVVVKSSLSKDATGRIVIRNMALSGGYPEQPGRIRIHHYVGDWTFQKLAAQKVKVTTSGYADPAGSIPLSFVNMFVEQQPYQMLMKMKTELAQSTESNVYLPDVLK